jgi:hypothetical protein
MILVTYATHNSGYLNALKESSKLNGYDLIILGENKKWEGFTQKFFDILSFLKTKSMDEIICFVDGFDVLTLGTKDEFINKFNSFNTDKVIFSASKDNFILQLIFGKINSNDSNFEYNRLCTGAYVGYCNKIIELFENICEIHKLKIDDDDQKNISVCYVNCKNCLQLDYDNSLFYCVESSNGIFEYINLFFKKQPYMELNNNFYFIEDNRLILKKNNVRPIFIQGNGNLNMDILAEKLNLPVKNTNNRNYFDYSTKGFLYKILTIFCGYLIVILHFLFNIFMIFIPYITNNIHILLLVIIINSFILTQWFLFGSCVLNKIENDLLSRIDTVYEDGKEKSSFVYYFSKYFGERNAYVFFSLIPLINSAYAGLKIMNILYKKKIYLKFNL